MNRRLIIVQSVTQWVQILRTAITFEIPELAGAVKYTNAFDLAIELVSKEKGELLVIASNMFHDNFYNPRRKVKTKIPNDKKDGNMLGKMIKEINPQAKVFIFSEFQPDSLEGIDGHIRKDNADIEKSVSAVLQLIKKQL